MLRPDDQSRFRPLLVVLLLSLAACTTYEPQPLPENENLTRRIDALHIDVRHFPVPALRRHPFDLRDGLDGVEIAMLAVANNPVLRAQRVRVKEAVAQAYAAGLLPDPQFSAGLDQPDTGTPARVTGFDLGLGYDVQALITRSAAMQAGEAARQQVDLELLWQEWQVIQQARLLTVQVQGLARKRDLLVAAQARYAERYRRARQLLARGDLTLEDAAAVASAWFDVTTRLNRVSQTDNRRQHELHALLGLAPEAKLVLAPVGPPPGQVALSRQILETLPRRRPDLRALQAGYRSQEQRVRKAILAQFPALDIGFTRARDIDGVYTTGFGITLNLPLFSGNRGPIAIERATRARLRAEYQARLDQARSDISRLQDRQRILQRQHARLQRHLPELETLLGAARQAYRRGDLAALDLLNLETTWLDQNLAFIDLEQALWEVRIALDTLLAWPAEED